MSDPTSDSSPVCPACEELVTAGVRVCPYCGEEIAPSRSRATEAVADRRRKRLNKRPGMIYFALILDVLAALTAAATASSAFHKADIFAGTSALASWFTLIGIADSIAALVFFVAGIAVFLGMPWARILQYALSAFFCLMTLLTFFLLGFNIILTLFNFVFFMAPSGCLVTPDVGRWFAVKSGKRLVTKTRKKRENPRSAPTRRVPPSSRDQSSS